MKIAMVPEKRSLKMPRRKRVSCAAMLLAVAVALPLTNRVLGMYMRRTGPANTSNRYRNPAIRAFLLVKVMCSPVGAGQGIRESAVGSHDDSEGRCCSEEHRRRLTPAHFRSGSQVAASVLLAAVRRQAVHRRAGPTTRLTPEDSTLHLLTRRPPRCY